MPSLNDGLVFRDFTLQSRQGTSVVSLTPIDVQSPMQLNPGIGKLKRVWDLVFGANVLCSMRIRVVPRRAVSPSDLRVARFIDGGAPSADWSRLGPGNWTYRANKLDTRRLTELAERMPLKAVRGCLELDLRGPMMQAQPILNLISELVDACEPLNASTHRAVARPQNFAEVHRTLRDSRPVADTLEDLQPVFREA